MNNFDATIFVRPAQALLDRGLTRSTTAEQLCARLEGKTFAVRTPSGHFDIYFVVQDGHLQMQSGSIAEPDAALTGTPFNLARLSGADPESVIRSGDVQVSGDAEVATEFRALLDILRPDWEEELSKITGDAFAHETGRTLRGLVGWATQARQSLERSMAEYLTEESRDLVASAELEGFYADVDATSAAVDRLEAKINLLRAR